jgi:hypothetical protein
MHKLYPFLRGLWVPFLVLGVLPSLAGDYVVQCVFQGGTCSLERDVMLTLVTRGPYLIFVFLLLLALTLDARRDYLVHKAMQQFSLAISRCKSSLVA